VNAQLRPDVSPAREPAGRPIASPADGVGSGVTARRVRFGLPEPVWLTAIQQLDVLVIILALFGCLIGFGEPLTLDYALVGVAAVVVYGRCVTPPDLRKALVFGTEPSLLTLRLLVEWGTVVGVLLLVGFALKISDAYSRSVLLTWFSVTPLALVGGRRLQIAASRWFNEQGVLASRYIIVGVNSVGIELAKRLQARSFLGFFDFRSPQRINRSAPDVSVVGNCRDVADFVREHAIHSVYIALPIANAPRIKGLLADLRDTTASVYFVPDVFAFDLIQARIVDLNGLPALAISDTPLHGSSALSKRVADVALSSAALLVLWPLMVAIAVAVKLGSPGPVLFTQRRYGLDGEQIVVYKFRTMTVLEDGAQVRQATRDDARVTRVGRILRRTSLDELPQLLNVLQGKMSLVGPRPHAIVHNELYRKVISGYMIRHKVRPGITGWAQVHGLRGETDTLEKMEKRVHYDLAYLQNWSLALDLRIMVRTVRILVNGKNAH
jgi:putative colanic acid biosynthesis UDP-glucose lipid carrier transferase